jgi:hypothetical protein
MVVLVEPVQPRPFLGLRLLMPVVVVVALRAVLVVLEVQEVAVRVLTDLVT